MTASVRELELIALAARGRLSQEQIERVSSDAFSTDATLFAWWCAGKAARLLGSKTSFFAARWMRVTAPRLALPLEVWAELNRETDEVIDAAEEHDRNMSGAEGARRS